MYLKYNKGKVFSDFEYGDLVNPKTFRITFCEIEPKVSNTKIKL